jgi:serine/threonine-protein kinase TTK/MPS1
MNCIADPKHRIDYPAEAIPRGATSQQGQPVDPQSMAVAVMPSAIDTMRHCLAYSKDERLTIPKLLEHEFLQPTLTRMSLYERWMNTDRVALSAIPAGMTPISREQMITMVKWVMQEGKGKTADDLGSVSECVLVIKFWLTSFQDLFDQLMSQNLNL